MGKQTNVKMWAMILVIVMVASTFIGLSALVVGTDTTAKVVGEKKVITHDEVASAYEDLYERQLNMKALEERRGMGNEPIPMSPPPQPETEAVWTYDFDSDTAGMLPAAPPWNNVDTSALGQPSVFGLDDFEDDVLGGTPDMPPWITVDGQSITNYWGRNYEDLPGDSTDILDSYHTGSDGYFYTIAAPATLTNEPAPGGTVPGSIYPGFSTGSVSAQMNDNGNGAQNYFGPVGIGNDLTTSAFAGGWVYMTATAQIDLILTDYENGADAVILVWWAGGMEYVDGGFIPIAGPSWGLNEWHEVYVEYDDIAQTWSLWYDGVEYIPGTPFQDAAAIDVDGLIWYDFGTANYYVDNFYHFEPPPGFTNNVEVVNTEAASGLQSIYIDQDGVAAGNGLASMTADFTPMMAGTGFWTHYLRTDDTAGNTNGAIAALLNQYGVSAIALRASGGQFQYNDGGAWTNAIPFAVSSWYEFNITFDTVAKTYMLDIEGSVFGPASFNTESGTLKSVVYHGTGGTQSEHYIDDVQVICNGQGPEIIVSNQVSNSAPNSLRIQEYNAAAPCYIAADSLGAGLGAVGQYSFWFYNTDNGGGNVMYLLDDGANMMTIISLGVNLVDNSGMNGQSQFVNNDGAGLWVVDGPTYTPNTWHQIAIDYDCSDFGVSGSTGSFTYIWDGGAPQGPFGMADPATFMNFIEIDGNAADSYGDFFYDDFYLSVNQMPGAPTNGWAELPGGGVETWDNYTVDLDNPVEGTVTGTFNDINEKPPAVPDGITQDIQEDLIPGSTTPVVLINAESFEGAWPPAGWTETGRWNGEAGPGTRPPGGGLLCADFDGGANQNGNLNTPVLDLAGAVSFDLDFWVYMNAGTEAGDLWLQYYDNTGTWDPIVDLNTVGVDAWNQYFDTANSDPQYLHAAFQVRWAATCDANNEDVFVDLVTIIRNDATPPYCSLEHRWRTENIATGASSLDLSVRARTNAGADDAFSIGIATAVGGPYTPVGITINSAILTTYTVSILGYDSVVYLNVIDDNNADPAQQDTVYIDAIWMAYYSMGGSVTTTQVATADNPVDGTVTGNFGLTNPPVDGTAQQIEEVAGGGGTLFSDDFESGDFVAGGWILNELTPGGLWAVGAPGNPGLAAIWNLIEAYALGERSIVKAIDCTGQSGITMSYDIETRDAAAPFYGTAGASYSTAGTGGPWTVLETFNAVTAWSARGPLTLPASCDNNPNVAIKLWMDYQETTGNLNDGVAFDNVFVGTNSALTLEHGWTLEPMPADSLTRTLYVTARYNTGSNDDFVFGWSQNLAGPYTPLPSITVNSDAFTPYTASIPVFFVGPFYVNVLDTGNEGTGMDSVYVDTIYVESEVSSISTDIVVHWDLSSDDGAGEDDIVSYDVFRADEEDGDDITGPYVYIGSSPGGTVTYNDVGEGADLANQAWYYVEANDGSQTNGSGLFSKLNFPPVAENLLTNGMTGLIISPFTPSITLTANANDTSNQYEAIPWMFMAEYFINVDPGEGLGLPIVPVDAVWDTYIEPLTATVDSSTWTPGTYTIGVRVAEDDGGATLWGPVSFITVDVVDGPPIANAGPDQTVAQHTLVTFDGSNSVDDVGITNYWWNFTDGGPQSLIGVGPAYTFDFEGIFVVTLTVMDTVGQTNSDIMQVNVTDGDPPVADAGPDQQVTPGDIVAFDGTASYDPGHLGEPIIDGISNWTWTFDDGTGAQTEWGSNPTHQFNIPGVYLVTLTVTDNAPAVTGGPYQAIDTMTVTVVQIFDIDVTPAMGSSDWILVSFPNQVSGDPLVIVQDAIDAGAGLVTWDIIQTYNATTGEWLTTSTFKPANLNNFNYVDNFHAFWIHITNYGDGFLTITGALAAPGEEAVMPLRAGWNLVGYPFGTTQEMFNTFGTLFSLDADIEVYDQLDPYRLRIADVWSEDHAPGGGYWVHVAFDEDMRIWAP